MKKFSQLNDTNLQETKSFEEKVQDLIQLLEIETQDVPVENVNFQIKANEQFHKALKSLVNETFLSEKISFLDKVKMTYYTGDTNWVDTEIEIVKESLKK